MDEPIRIFSDLHLAHPACLIESVEQLRPLFEGAGTVIFNGDTIEHRHRKLREEGLRQLDQLRMLLQEMGIKAIFLRGNHDPEIFERDYLDLAKGRVLVTHGDALFPHLSPWSREIWEVKDKIDAVRSSYDPVALANDLDTALACTHECRFLPNEPDLNTSGSRLIKWLHSIGRIVWPPQVPIRILKAWISIPEHAHSFLNRHRPEGRVLLFGHTHLPGIWRRGDRVAINTGGYRSLLWARGVELSGEELVVRKIKKTGEGLLLGREICRVSLAKEGQ